MISELTAKNLINEISAVIDYDINIMNEAGAIIASTNFSRIGQFHEGAYQIINNNLEELLVYYDDEYEGCKKGVNFPIVMEGMIVGVIGITGEVSQIMKYGKLVKKVTEILIKDLFHIQQEAQREQAKSLFINRWLNSEMKSSAEIAKGLDKYGLAISKHFIVAIIKSVLPNAPAEKFLKEKFDSCNMLSSFNGDFGIVIANFKTPQEFSQYISSCFSDPFPETHFLCTIGCDEKEIQEFITFVDIYYQNNGSIHAISNEMFVHKNTVQYKIHKILNRIDLDLRIAKDLTILYLASIWYSSKIS